MYPLKMVLLVVALDPLEVELGPRGEEDHLKEEVNPLEVEEDMKEEVDSLEVEDIREKVDHLEVEDHPNQTIPPPKEVVALS
jgi:hypothetical protein